ncbi:hypothetical protein [Nocardia thraciensis]
MSIGIPIDIQPPLPGAVTITTVCEVKHAVRARVAHATANSSPLKE